MHKHIHQNYVKKVEDIEEYHRHWGTPWKMNFWGSTEIVVYFGMLSSAAKLKRSAEVMYVIKHNHKVLKVIKSDQWMLLNALERPVKSVPNLLPLSMLF